MRTGLINLQGIRNIILSDSISWGNEGQYCINVQYKGLGNQSFRYKTKTERDEVWEEIKKELIK